MVELLLLLLLLLLLEKEDPDDDSWLPLAAEVVVTMGSVLARLEEGDVPSTVFS